jgi:hypothetical protein
MEPFDMAPAKQDCREAITRTEIVVVDVSEDPCRHVGKHKYYVNATQVQLIRFYGPQGLARRYNQGMPTPMKIVLGNKTGFDDFQITDLQYESSCQPDAKHVGSYFLGGLPVNFLIDILLSLPAYGGESANVDDTKNSVLDQVHDPPRTFAISRRHVTVSKTTIATGDHASIMICCGPASLFGMCSLPCAKSCNAHSYGNAQ